MLKAIRQFFKKEQKVEVLPEYQKWRDGIFTVTSEQAGVPRDEPERVYGVIMDVGLANDDGTPSDKNLVITETAFASGEASLQTSFGGGIIGLGSNQEVSEQVQAIISLAQPLINTATPVDNHDLPESRMEIAHTQYDHSKHTLETLQSSMMDWLKHQFNLTIKPIVGQNFFAYQTNDTPGKESFTLFYFDFEE